MSRDAPRADPLQQSREFAAALRRAGRPPLQTPSPGRWLILHRRLPPGLPVAMVSRARMDPESLPARLAGAGLDRTPVLLAPEEPTPGLVDIGAVRLARPASVAEIDLCPDIGLRRAELHQKWRNRLNRAERLGLSVHRASLPCDPGHWLLRADALQQRDRGYRTWPAGLTLAYASANPGKAVLFQVADHTGPVAGMLFLRHGAGATYHVGHTTDRGRALCAHNLILWTAAEWLARNGCSRLDLGLVDPITQPGLARFKLGAGARQRLLGGTWLWWRPISRPVAAIARRSPHTPPAPSTGQASAGTVK